MTDYTYWQNALAGKFGPIHDGEPQPGFYRMCRKGQIDQPVAIWAENGGMQALVSDDEVNADTIWTYVADKPISEDVYRAVMAGGLWPTIAPSVAAPSNSESADPAEVLRDQIEAAKADLKLYAEIKDDQTQAAAQSLRSRLLELSREADKTREEQKAPHLKAGKDIDAKWQPLVKDAKAAADTVAKAMGAWETEKDRRRAAAQREAEEARRKAEEEARKAAQANMPPPAPVELPPMVEPVAAAPIKGAYGRAASVRTVRIARVVDQDKLYEAVRNNHEVKAVLAKVAQAIVTGGETVAGVEVEIEKKVA
jgi:hypothetical protein